MAYLRVKSDLFAAAGGSAPQWGSSASRETSAPRARSGGHPIRGPPLRPHPLSTSSYQPSMNFTASQVPGECSGTRGNLQMELRQMVTDHERQIFANSLAEARATRGFGFRETSRSVIGKAHIQFGNLYALFEDQDAATEQMVGGFIAHD